MLVLLISNALAGKAIAKAQIGYPPGGEGDHECTAHLLVDKAGQAEAVMIADCPDNFAAECREAMSKWRWEPDETTFIERRTVSFKQSSPWANPTSPTVLEGAVEALVKSVHHTELKPAERIPPKFPTAAEGQSGKCKSTVVVPVSGGAPEYIEVEDCEEVFHKAARMALYEWDFAPLEDSGEALWVRSKIALVFDEPPDPEPISGEAIDAVLTLDQAPPPSFPTGAKKYSPARCIAEFTVEADGGIDDIDVRECESLFHVATENAVQRWKFTHTGEPRDIRVEYPVEFLSKRDQRKKMREAAK